MHASHIQALRVALPLQRASIFQGCIIGISLYTCICTYDRIMYGEVSLYRGYIMLMAPCRHQFQHSTAQADSLPGPELASGLDSGGCQLPNALSLAHQCTRSTCSERHPACQDQGTSQTKRNTKITCHAGSTWSNRAALAVFSLLRGAPQELRAAFSASVWCHSQHNQLVLLSLSLSRGDSVPCQRHHAVLTHAAQHSTTSSTDWRRGRPTPFELSQERFVGYSLDYTPRPYPATVRHELQVLC